MQNIDAQGVAHYPGWSKAVLQYLYEQRKITASGHETTDTDPGSPSPATIIHSRATSWAPTIFRSSCWPISIRSRKPERWSW